MTETRARIEVDRTKCTGIGICESIADTYFELNDDGELLLPSGDTVAPDDIAVVREAASGCPVAALRIVES